MGPEEKKAKALEKARAYYYANKERCLEGKNLRVRPREESKDQAYTF